MHAKLERRLARLERQRRSVLVLVEGWSEDRLRLRPAPGAWSAVEVLDHLVKVEEALVASVRSRLGAGIAVGAPERVRAAMVRWVMRSPMRVRLPAGASVVTPTAEARAGQVLARWAAVREELGTLAGSLTPVQCRGGVFTHPVSGAMTFAMALGFVSAHLSHHGWQLRRLRRSV